MTFLVFYLLPILIFIAIRWFQAEPGSSVKDLFSDPECKKCEKKRCFLCDYRDRNEILIAGIFTPLFNVLALLAWLLITLISYIPIKELWDKFINSKVK